MAWEPLPLPTDEASIITQILTRLIETIPGWVPNEGAPEVALAEEIGHQLALVNQAAVNAVNYAAAGVASAFGFTPVAGTRAILPAVTLTAQLPPSAGTAPFSRAVTVPARFTIAVDGKAFVVPKQVTKVAAFTAVAEGDFTGYWRGTISVDFEAYDVGDEWNTGAPGDDGAIQTASAIIIAAELTAPAAGGEGAETLDAFLGRFTAWLATLKPGGVRASDIAAFAATVPGVQRALTLDRYNPADPGTPAERTVTVVPVTSTGADLDELTAARLAEALENIREVGFVFHLLDPTRTPVSVDVTVVPSTGTEPGTVLAAVQAAIARALSPSVWGTVDGDPSTWMERPSIRTLDIAIIAAGVPGVASIGSIELNGGTADVSLTGPGALIDATVVVTAA